MSETPTRPLDEALDALDGPAEVAVEEPAGTTTIDVVESDRLGVRVRELRIGHDSRDVVKHAGALPGRVRAVPAHLQPVEVDASLGGATLRTSPDEMRRGRFFEVNVRPDETEVHRYRVEQGERKREEFTLTRDQLRELIDEVRGD